MTRPLDCSTARLLACRYTHISRGAPGWRRLSSTANRKVEAACRSRVARYVMPSRLSGAPAVSSYHRWFGGLVPAYRLVGFTECRPYPPRTRPPRSKSSVTARLSDDQLLDLLREVLRMHGFLNHRVVDAAEGVPHSATYVKRFGSMKRAYRLAGFSGDPQLGDGKRSPEARRAITSVLSNAQMLSAARRALKKHGKLTRKTIDTSGESPSSTTYLDRFGSMERVYRLIGYRPGVRQQSCIRTRGLSNEQMLEFVA